ASLYGDEHVSGTRLGARDGFAIERLAWRPKHHCLHGRGHGLVVGRRHQYRSEISEPARISARPPSGHAHDPAPAAVLSAQRFQCVIHASHRDDVDAIDALLGLVCMRDDRSPKPELGSLLETFLTALDRPDLTCQTDLAKNDR